MRFLVKVPKGTRLVVCGDIHEHEAQFKRLLKEVKPGARTWVASVGDIYDKGDGIDAAERIVDKMKELVDRGVGFVIRGNHELKHIRRAKRHKKSLSPQLEWMKKQPTSILFEFYNRNRVLMVHGGVTPHHKIKDVEEDIDTCYIRWVDENGHHISLKKQIVDGVMQFAPAKWNSECGVWHEKYDGRFGYIVSGHFAQKDGKPKFYNYSCNIDTACYATGILTAQEFTEMGIKGETIGIKGPAKWSDVESLYREMAQSKN
jgi:UDP-2,3-diacylglucosamine pyrophosphatase LpxH